MLVKLGMQLLGQLVGIFGERGKRTQDQIDARITSMQRSWTDEFIVVIFFSPLVVGWFSDVQSEAYIAMLGSLPEWYRNLIFAITGAVFGLGKLGR